MAYIVKVDFLILRYVAVKLLFKKIERVTFVKICAIPWHVIDNRNFSNPMFLYFFSIPCLILSNFAKETTMPVVEKKDVIEKFMMYK